MRKEDAGAREKTYDKAATDRLWEAVACESGEANDKQVDDALARGANPNADDWEGQETPLLMAIMMGRERAARALLAAGADPERINEYDQSPLELAACAPSEKAGSFVKGLVEAGAHVDAVNAKGWTALMHACDVGSEEGARVLLDLGGNIEHADPKGWTPLVTAIYGSNGVQGRACLELIVERGARIGLRDVERAEAWGRWEVASWLASVRLARIESADLGELTQACAGQAKPGVRL